jgi:hypothetical protein
MNLVRETSLELEATGRTQRVDMVTSVLPRVALDVVSYSCYDAALAEDADRGGLWRAIKLVGGVVCGCSRASCVRDIYACLHHACIHTYIRSCQSV